MTKVKIEFNSSFYDKVSGGIEAVGKMIAKNASDIVKSEASGSGKLSSSYKVEVKEDSVRVYSELPEALFVEYGTGQRGSEGFESYFKEEKPVFTVPIKPKNAKVLHWESGGKQVFAKSTKGMKPIAPLRRATFMALGKETDKAFKKGFK